MLERHVRRTSSLEHPEVARCMPKGRAVPHDDLQRGGRARLACAQLDVTGDTSAGLVE
jgi:hypothetical protein